MSSLQPEFANRPLPPSESSTVPYSGPPGTASRVLDRLDQLAAAVEREASSGTAATIPSSALQTPPSPSPQSASPQSAASSLQALQSNPEDECLDSYLQKYMQRLTGKTAAESAATSAQALGPSAKPARPEPAVAEVVRQPTPAPERRSQLTAMRDVAIDSARRAVSESSQIQRILATRRSYQQAKLASLASTIVGLAYFGTHAPLALTGSMLLFTVAIVLSVRFVLLFRLATASGVDAAE